MRSVILNDLAVTAFGFFFPLVRLAYTHALMDTHLVLLQVTSYVSRVLVIVCMYAFFCLFLFSVALITVELISPSGVNPLPCPLMVHTAQPAGCTYVFMHYGLCEMHIYSLYVVI